MEKKIIYIISMSLSIALSGQRGSIQKKLNFVNFTAPLPVDISFFYGHEIHDTVAYHSSASSLEDLHLYEAYTMR